MATYQVQTGDTIGAIAKRFNVPTSAVSGFRSNDPNTIFPDEILTINEQQNLGGQAPTGQVPISPAIPLPAPTPQIQPPVQPSVQPPVQPPPPVQPTPQPAPQPKTYTTPSGAVVDETGNLISEPKPLEQYGISSQATERGFQTNPFGTLSQMVKQVTKSLGLPDVRDNLTKISNEIESLANERDAKIKDIQDNPWQSASTKQTLTQKLSNEYEQKIANRTNRLTLMQNAYQDARQQAQFAVTTAVNLYDKERAIKATHLEKELDRAEKAAEAQRKLGELSYSIQNIGGREVRFGFDKEGNVVSRTDLGQAGKPLEAEIKTEAFDKIKLEAAQLFEIDRNRNQDKKIRPDLYSEMRQRAPAQYRDDFDRAFRDLLSDETKGKFGIPIKAASDIGAVLDTFMKLQSSQEE